jgi:plastocyanin
MRRSMTALALAALATGALAAPAGGAASRTVKVDDNRFSPKALTVTKGTRVTWRWVGAAPHNVVVTKGPAKFASRTQTAGAFRRTLTRKGSYTIVCTLHSGMRQTLRVR